MLVVRLAGSLLAQVILAYVLGFAVPYFGGIGNGLELIAIPIGVALGVWLGGWFVMEGRPSIRLRLKRVKRLVATLIGAGVATLPLAIPGVVFGFAGLLLPLVGAMIGFYVMGLLGAKK